MNTKYFNDIQRRRCWDLNVIIDEVKEDLSEELKIKMQRLR